MNSESKIHYYLAMIVSHVSLVYMCGRFTFYLHPTYVTCAKKGDLFCRLISADEDESTVFLLEGFFSTIA